MQKNHSQSRILASLLGGLAVVLLGVLAASGGGQLFLNASAQDATVSDTATPQEMMRELDDLIQRYQSVELDAAFLSSADFRALRDFSIVIPRPSDIGRENPFAPLPGVEDVEPSSQSEDTPFATVDVSFGQLIENEI